jgi:hypothetical protein
MMRGMRVVCSYCHQLIRTVPDEGSGVSHGMCAACDQHFERLWGGMTLGEYLDELPHPILFVDTDAGRVEFRISVEPERSLYRVTIARESASANVR